jgi:hypothetical protein
MKFKLSTRAVIAVAALVVVVGGLVLYHAITTAEGSHVAGSTLTLSSPSPAPSSTPAPETPTPVPASKPTPTYVDYVEDCISANQTYNATLSTIMNEEQFGYNALQPLADSSPQQYDTDVNQTHVTANSSLTNAYTGYLESIHAIPGCQADFSAPVLFPTD